MSSMPATDLTHTFPVTSVQNGFVGILSCLSLSHPHTLMVLSQPAVTRRLHGVDALPAGAHDTDVTPMGCVPGSCAACRRAACPWSRGSQDLALVAFQAPAADAYSRMDTVPSLDPTARIRPSSCGAQATLLMDAVCSVAGVTYTCFEPHDDREGRDTCQADSFDLMVSGMFQQI
eukprot:365617-Chlamydomonas_euryale.AAC.16